MKFLNLHIILYFLLLSSFSTFGQQNDAKKKSEAIRYGRSAKYKTNPDHSHQEPRDISYYSEDDEYTLTEEQTGSYYQESDQEIRKMRRLANKQQKSMKSLTMPEPVEFPEFDESTVDDPDVDIPDSDIPDPTKVNINTYRTIALVLLLAILAVLIFFYFKRRQATTKTINTGINLEWNPEVVTKSDLEIRLENAEKSQNYREAYRVHFTYLLQALIRIDAIRWKKEKTNHEYIYEIKALEHRTKFSKAVYFFDLIWYGEFQLNEAKYNKIISVVKPFIDELNAIKIEE